MSTWVDALANGALVIAVAPAAVIATRLFRAYVDRALDRRRSEARIRTVRALLAEHARDHPNDDAEAVGLSNTLGAILSAQRRELSNLPIVDEADQERRSR